MLTDQRLFRARALEPVAALGDVLYLLDQSGPLSSQRFSTPYFAVAGIEPVRGLAPHNLLLLWSQAGTAPAGYGTGIGNTNLIPEAASGNIAQSASVKIANPKILQQGPRQLFHMRFTVKTLALTGIKEHDLEVQVFNPSASARFGLANASPGFINMSDQMQDPADAIDSPAQNANQTLPAAYAAVHPRDQENLTEMFIWEINGPTFQIWNNGSASLTAGAIGIRIWGFRYDLQPLNYNQDEGWVNRWVYGRLRAAPPSDKPIVVVPSAGILSSGASTY